MVSRRILLVLLVCVLASLVSVAVAAAPIKSLSAAANRPVDSAASIRPQLPRRNKVGRTAIKSNAPTQTQQAAPTPAVAEPIPEATRPSPAARAPLSVPEPIPSVAAPSPRAARPINYGLHGYKPPVQIDSAAVVSAARAARRARAAAAAAGEAAPADLPNVFAPKAQPARSRARTARTPRARR